MGVWCLLGFLVREESVVACQCLEGADDKATAYVGVS